MTDTATIQAALTTLPKLVLDPNDDQTLLAQLFARVLSASNGTLNDTSPGSALAALAEGQVFATAELLYYLNLLPEAVALEVLRLSGVSRSPGTLATGTLTFLLSALRVDDFIVPSGYVVPFAPTGAISPNAGYTLLADLVIKAGTLSATVAVQATEVGSYMNAAPFQVAITSTGLNGLSTIYNATSITGGSDLEALSSTIARAQTALRTRNALVSITDYEQKAVDLLGNGYSKAIPFLNANKLSTSPGQVHVFLVDLGSGSPVAPDASTCAYIQQALQDLSFAASKTWVSPVDLAPIEVSVEVLAESLDSSIADDIDEAIEAYLAPANLGIGGTVKYNSLLTAIANVPGVTEVTSLLINGSPLNHLLTNEWTVPVLDTVQISLTDPSNTTQVFYRGTGVGDPD